MAAATKSKLISAWCIACQGSCHSAPPFPQIYLQFILYATFCSTRDFICILFLSLCPHNSVMHFNSLSPMSSVFSSFFSSVRQAVAVRGFDVASIQNSTTGLMAQTFCSSSLYFIVIFFIHYMYVCCIFFLFLFDKSPCHVSAGKTTPTWQGQRQWHGQGHGGAQEVAPACALPRSPPKNIYHVQIFHVVLLLS